jgi:hypothetical protein
VCLPVPNRPGWAFLRTQERLQPSWWRLYRYATRRMSRTEWWLTGDGHTTDADCAGYRPSAPCPRRLFAAALTRSASILCSSA